MGQHRNLSKVQDKSNSNKPSALGQRGKDRGDVLKTSESEPGNVNTFMVKV